MEQSDGAFYKRLRLYNVLVGLLHLGQAVAILLLSNSFSLPIQTNYLSFDPATGTSAPLLRTVGRVRLGPLVAVFLLLAAADHLVVSLPRAFDWYVRNLERHINYARWTEYFFSASLMIVIIAMLSGVYDLATLLLLFFLNGMMILFGWMMELQNRTTERVDWTAFSFGTLAGIIPWVVVGLYFGSAAAEAANGVPKFVYGIMVSIFVFFSIFAVNMALQYRGKGRWNDYLYGEKVYILLSLVAKSLLAWQVFAGTLR